MVAAPSVDADRNDALTVDFDRAAQAFEDIAIKANDIPKRSARQFGAGIVEAVDFLQFDFLKVGGGGDYAAAACSEVDGYEGVRWHGQVIWKFGSFFITPFDAIPNMADRLRNADEKESCP
jgi:hypothetical protein